MFQRVGGLASSGTFHNWFHSGERVDGLFSEKFHGWIPKFLPHFLAIYWWLVALNALHIELILDQPWNTHATQKFCVLSLVTKSLIKQFEDLGQRFAESFTQNLMLAVCMTLSFIVMIEDPCQHAVSKPWIIIEQKRRKIIARLTQ